MNRFDDKKGKKNVLNDLFHAVIIIACFAEVMYFRRFF